MREAERVRTIATEPAIYGVVLVAGLVVVVGESAEASWDVFAKVFLTVLVFWAAHVYAGTVAHLGDEPMSGVPLPTRVLTAGREAVVHSWGMLLTSMLPLLVILLGHVGVIDDQQAVWGSLWTSVALLGVLGYAKVAVWTANPWVRLAGGGITSALGLLLVLLKSWVH